MRYTPVFHVEVQKDVEAAYDWYESKQENLGEKFLLSIRAKMLHVCESPELFGGKATRHYREAKLEFFPFSIIFTVYKQKKIVFVSSVHHHKRHPKNKHRK